jgi:hypothetical protein
VRQILPRIKLLNPENIKKVSCFENFKDIAFYQGNNEYAQEDENIPVR